MPKPEQVSECIGVPRNRAQRRETREYLIHLITPLFGGGAEAGEPDPTYPIRGTAIRGQLQFWWRATCGAQYSSADELFKRHADVWGQTDMASPVEISVRDVHVADSRPCARYEWNPQARGGRGVWRLTWDSLFRESALPYVLFPFQGKPPRRYAKDGHPEKAPANFIENGSFRLCLRFPNSLRKDVETALWAWVNFGGIGARTRRGCGSLFCAELAPGGIAALPEWYRCITVSYPSAARDWPVLPNHILYYPQAQTVIQAWKKIIELFMKFRQGVGVGRNPGKSGSPGRSRFPEAETIREAPNSGANRQVSGHQRLQHIPADAFPRAEFGLPIVFHFKDHGEPPGRADIQDWTVYPENDEHGEQRYRMASPLILKPLALADGRALGIVMRLITRPLQGVEVRSTDSSGEVLSLGKWSTDALRGQRLAQYRDSPIQLAQSGSALDGFLEFVRQRFNFQVVP